MFEQTGFCCFLSLLLWLEFSIQFYKFLAEVNRELFALLLFLFLFPCWCMFACILLSHSRGAMGWSVIFDFGIS